MFLIELNYIKPLGEIDKYLDEHKAFLDRFYASGNFIASGRKSPRTGGIILAHANNMQEIKDIVSEDPFHKNQLAEYSFTEFIPTRYINELDSIFEEA